MPSRSSEILSRQVIFARSSADSAGPSFGLMQAADVDVDGEDRRHHQAGQDAGEPELQDRLARDHGVEDEHDARRDQDAERAAALDDAGHHDLVVATAEQLRQRDGGADRHAGDAKPFIAAISTMRPMVPSASPPRTGPNQTWNIR